MASVSNFIFEHNRFAKITELQKMKSTNGVPVSICSRVFLVEICPAHIRISKCNVLHF